MPVLKKYIIPLAIIFFSVFFMKCCRVVPVSSFFSGYEVVFVSKELPEENALNILSKNGCTNVISRANQKIPLNLPENSPEAALAKSSLEKSTYIKDRTGFFFDKSEKNNVFYVPEKNLKEAAAAVKEISENEYSAGMNAEGGFPFISIAVVIIFSVLLAFFSENRILCGLSFAYPVLFSFFMPFCSVAAGLCLFELFVFFFLRFWGRKNSAKRLIKSTMLTAILATSFMCMVFTKIQAGFFFVLMCVSELSLFFLYKNIREKNESRYSFRPVKIRTAFSIRILTEKGRKILGLCPLAVLVIFAGTLFSSNLSAVFGGGKSSGAMLPSCKAPVSALPGLNDFFEWKWEALTFPYRSINVKSRKNTAEPVVFKNFQKKDGFIQESVNSISFNEEFKKNALRDIEDLDYPALEKMIAGQGENARFGYVSSEFQNISLAMMILLAIAFFVPLSFYLTAKKWEPK